MIIRSKPGIRRCGRRGAIVAGLLLVAAATTALAISVKQPKRVEGEIAAARAFKSFPLYWVGERFEQWDLQVVELPGHGGFASLIYGDCEIEDPDGIFGHEGGSCTPPLQIQISPLCAHLDVVARAQLWKRRSIRGAPVGTIDSAPVLLARGAQVKVYRGQGSDPGLPMRALRAIRSLNTVPPLIEASGQISGADPRVLSGSRPCRDTRGGAVLIDEERGTYRGVGIGAPPEQVWQRFGTRRFATQRESWTPGKARWLELGGPNVLRHPCRPRPGHPRRLRVLRYEDVSFLFCRGRVFALMVIDKGARTRAGLALGDDLARARSLYPGLRCGEASSGDRGHYPYCVGSMRPKRSLWFGQDPIASLTISTTRFPGVR